MTLPFFRLVMSRNSRLTEQHRGQASWGRPRTRERGCIGGPPLWNPAWGTLWNSSPAGDRKASPLASQHLPAAFPALEKREKERELIITLINLIDRKKTTLEWVILPSVHITCSCQKRTEANTCTLVFKLHHIDAACGNRLEQLFAELNHQEQKKTHQFCWVFYVFIAS